MIQAGEVVGGKGAKTTHGSNQFEERILIKINNGNDLALKASSHPGVSDPRCLVK